MSNLGCRSTGELLNICWTMIAMILIAAPLHAESSAPMLEDRLIAPQNAERTVHGLSPLRWNPDLAQKAVPLAREMADKGHFIEGSAANAFASPTGENIWAGTTAAYAPEEMVQMWLDERRYYKPGNFPENSNTGQWHDVGHYTQIVWKRTKEVGCAIASGAELDFLVCLYAEGGNVIGERPF